MNLKTAKINTRVKRKRNSVRTGKRSNFSLLAVFKFVVPLAVMFGLAAAMTLFNSETEKLNRETSDLKRQIHALERDMADYKIMHEKFKGRYILRQVANFDLKLRSPVPGQVKKLKVRKTVAIKRGNQPENLLVSQR